jgi:hypothetical protein
MSWIACSTGVLKTDNACFTSVIDTGNACFADNIDTETVVKLSHLVYDFEVTINKKTNNNYLSTD